MLDLDAIRERAEKVIAVEARGDALAVSGLTPWAADVLALVGRIQELDTLYGMEQELREAAEARAVKAKAERDEARLELAKELGPAELLSRFTRLTQGAGE